MNECDLFQDIQTYLNENREMSEEAYEKLLEEFYQIPSYVEHFMQRKAEQDNAQ